MSDYTAVHNGNEAYNSSDQYNDKKSSIPWGLIGMGAGVFVLIICIIYFTLLLVSNRQKKRKDGYFWRRSECKLCREKFKSNQDRIIQSSKTLGCLPKVKLYHEDCASGRNGTFQTSMSWREAWRTMNLCSC
ncbi:uncharacterized protein I206_105803 [Kwoniella pini CBS 10737]|uniref:Uncharacterized protein n=1 Tax=Kwoniella pini CBS 10737 TaxID=1296096 RepID=A0A1B9I068_9TREE|nr:uncharacterized protein I206_04623 [Kwoniella pini CBS 10737]OCF48936.1 hypothetical protein I206_04623 [Kwoniella pini CBS 10737]